MFHYLLPVHCLFHDRILSLYHITLYSIIVTAITCHYIIVYYVLYHLRLYHNMLYFTILYYAILCYLRVYFILVCFMISSLYLVALFCVIWHDIVLYEFFKMHSINSFVILCNLYACMFTFNYSLVVNTYKDMRLLKNGLEGDHLYTILRHIYCICHNSWEKTCFQS